MESEIRTPLDRGAGLFIADGMREPDEFDPGRAVPPRLNLSGRRDA